MLKKLILAPALLLCADAALADNFNTSKLTVGSTPVSGGATGQCLTTTGGVLGTAPCVSPPLTLNGVAGGGTFATAVFPLTINRSNANFDTALTINTPTAAGGVNGNAFSDLDIYSDPAGVATAIRLFTNQTSPAVPYTWFTPGGMFTTVNIFLCTNRTGTTGNGLTQAVTCLTPSSGSTGGALEVVNDTVGPAAEFGVIAQDATPGTFNTDWRDGSQALVAGVAVDGTRGFGKYRGTTNWSNLDTWIGRGNQAALLQVGGPDSFTPIAQTFAAPSAIAPVTLLALASAAGQNVLQYNYNLSGQIPNTIVVGMTVTDATTPSAIPANTTVASINYGAATFTLSNNIAGSGVLLSDNIVFSAPNTAGANLTVAAGKGTGTGAPGLLQLAYAPSGASGSAQNALTNAVTIGGSTPVAINAATAFNASLKVKTRVVSAATDTVSAATDYFLCVSYTSTGAVTETLPAGVAGQTFLIKDCGGNAGTNAIAITPAAGTIDGASSYSLNTNYGSVAVTYVNSQWSVN